MLTYQNTLSILEIAQLYEGALPYLRIKIDTDRTGSLCVSGTFDCGQSFRFDPVEDTVHTAEYAGVAFGRAVSFAEDDEYLYIYNATEQDFFDVWYGYLGLDLNYNEVRRKIADASDKPVIEKALECGDGIRILAQERWETLCSFIISQNNNIPRIKKIVRALSVRLGDPIDISHMNGHLSAVMKEQGAYSFPGADSIRGGGVELLAELRTGFRAKYIYDAAMRVADGLLDLETVSKEPSLERAAEMLCQIKGVGPKVAACSLLFGFRRYDAFPIDVWIRRVMEKYFPSDFTPESLGQYAGIAQQYLFYYERYLSAGNNND
ncbi:MAG: DNA glycosylase [Clostridia bacterium]|nr:DNA glycosylase [Clostridia bacterium]